MTLIHLSEIGLKAIEYQQASGGRKAAEDALAFAYSDWKEAHGIERVERGDGAWEMMMDETQSSYQALLAARRMERNARERLFRACRRAVA
ncbi:hypothetical protein EC845_2547 [Comamonas sp. BIGb0124]|uniref:hypothetical protein n=1 Tax=Comamonas sp. BIGb0124 TaxID=2485130 RepID=UPI000F464D76|nr:hypothetical protein [Comamonas sp. BIGb0124]ROR21724.1 hypothetical protein EC845_2547 [Comamonas sp. BIGb0124]